MWCHMFFSLKHSRTLISVMFATIQNVYPIVTEPCSTRAPDVRKMIGCLTVFETFDWSTGCCIRGSNFAYILILLNNRPLSKDSIWKKDLKGKDRFKFLVFNS